MPKIERILAGERLAPVLRILQAALQSAEPAAAVRRSVRLQGPFLFAQGRDYDLRTFERIHLLSLGKAGVSLAGALEDLLGGFLARGLVITKTAGPTPPGRFPVLEAGHPVPDGRSLRAGQSVLEFLRQVGPRDLLICAISGGASSLVAAPHSPITLADLQLLTSRLLACGATIDEINTLRRHLDVLKGGGFLRQTQASVLALVLSDVIGNPLEAIASGPTAPDPTTRAGALVALQKYDLLAGIGPEILAVLESAPETLKPGDARLQNVHNLLIGSNLQAIQAGLQQAAHEGFHPHLLRADLAGEARQAARELCGVLRRACLEGEPAKRPFCIIAGGETTVRVAGDGRGGRNTELALAAVRELADLPDVLLVTLATDGEDGQTDAAGAVVRGDTLRRAGALGLDAADYLRRNDSYSFFAALDDLVVTGPTGTNVNDLVFLFGF